MNSEMDDFVIDYQRGKSAVLQGILNAIPPDRSPFFALDIVNEISSVQEIEVLNQIWGALSVVTHEPVVPVIIRERLFAWRTTKLAWTYLKSRVTTTKALPQNRFSEHALLQTGVIDITLCIFGHYSLGGRKTTCYCYLRKRDIWPILLTSMVLSQSVNQTIAR